MPLQPGTRVDRYVVDACIGAGGTAEVYAVHHTILGSPAALKVLHLRSDRLFERLLREGRAQGRLRHPNVVAVLDLIEVDGEPGLLMERVDGPSLAEVLQREGALPLPRVERIARGLMSGLRAAHRLGIVHRDLKPANVLLAPGDVPRIADFGLATAMAGDPDPGLTRPGTPVGTPAYMAPEQHEDSSRVDARADVFALGVVLYEMLCGAAPAAGAHPLAAWNLMSQRQWKPPSEVVPGLDPRVDRAIAAALEPAREARIASVEALWEALFGEPFPAEDEAGAAPHSEALPTTLGRDQPAGRTMPSSAIPNPARELVGRGEELGHALERFVARGGLITLVGTAGVGKTRLANEIAVRWREEARKARWIELQSVSTEEDMLRTIAERLALSGETSSDAIGRHLDRQGATLLVLDNLEQLPSAAEQIAAWGRAAPSLRILATSRRPLELPEEQVIELRPIAVPDDPTDALASEGWALLASAAPPGALDDIDGETAHRLLVSLDGLPLALLLAAARLEVLTVSDLEQRMGDRFALLSAPTSKAQRGTLYNAIERSWVLLSPAERLALACLSSFAAPFDLVLAERLLAPEPGEPAAMDTLHALVRSSLLLRTKGRFSMLAAVREFAAEQLGAERAAVWLRHAAIQTDIVRAHLANSGRLSSSADAVPLVERMADFDAVLERTADQPDLIEDAMLAAAGRCAVFELRGPMDGVVRTVDRALALPGADASSHADLRIRLRIRRAAALRQTGRFALAEAELREIVAGEVPPAVRAVVFANLADLCLESPYDAEALPLYQRAVAEAEQHGPQHILATALAAIGSIRWSEDRAGTEAIFERALRMVPQGDRVSLMQIRKLMAWVLLKWGELARSEEEYREILAIAKALGHRRNRLYATGQIGLLREAAGDVEEAEQCFRQTAEGMEEDSDTIYAAYYTIFRARTLARLGRWPEAMALARTSLTVSGLDENFSDFARMFLALDAARERRTAEAAARGESTSSLRPEIRAMPRRVAEAFVALDAGEREPAIGLVAEIRAMPSGETSQTLLDLMAALLEEEASTWRISADGSAVHRPDGLEIDLGKYVANARILAHLARQRIEHPGEATDAVGLAAVGWPGERIVPSAAANRVRVALSALRRAGLSELIERSGSGWRLDPARPLRYPASPTTT